MPIDPSGTKLSDANDGTSVLIVGGAPVEKRFQKRTGPPTPATKISPPRTSPVVAVQQHQQEKNGNYQQSPRTADREKALRSGTAASPMFQQQPTPQPTGGGSTGASSAKD